MRTVEGMLKADGLRLAIVVSRFNELITNKLVGGAEDAIRRTGGSLDDVTLVWVPGAFEIPLAAQKLAASGKFDAVIALGAVIRGATPHFDYVCAEAAKGVAQASLSTGVPVAFGILTTETSSRLWNGPAPSPAIRVRCRYERHRNGQLVPRAVKGVFLCEREV